MWDDRGLVRSFAGAVVNGNSNTLSSNLNGRVIQLVVAKNLTLAQAWGIIDLARTQNGRTNVTSFPFFVTSEFYTLGSAWELSKLAANTSVANGGNWSASLGRPPTQPASADTTRGGGVLISSPPYRPKHALQGTP